MSNCVEVHTDVVIAARNMDVARLMTDIKAYEASSPVCPEFGLEDPTTFYFWWFLGSDNCTLTFRGKVLNIALGQHRSGHTQRDLRGLGNFLGRYLTIPSESRLICPMMVSDEFDGFRTTFKQELEICHPQ